MSDTPAAAKTSVAALTPAVAASPRPARPARQAPPRPAQQRRAKPGKAAPPIKHTATRNAAGPKAMPDLTQRRRRYPGEPK